MKKYQSFEEEFFEKLNEYVEQLEKTLAETEAEKTVNPVKETPIKPFTLNEELEEMKAFREVFTDGAENQKS